MFIKVDEILHVLFSLTSHQWNSDMSHYKMIPIECHNIIIVVISLIVALTGLPIG